MNSNNPARRLTRSRDDRFIGGVAAGIANYFNIDPVLIRVAFVVSIAFGGIGVLAYLALLVLVPVDGDSSGPVVQPSGGKRFLVITGTILLGILALASIDEAGFGGWFFGIGPGPLFGILIWGLAIAGVIWLVREATSGDNATSGAFGRPSSPPPTTPPPSSPAGASKAAAMGLPVEPKTEKLQTGPAGPDDETVVLSTQDDETAVMADSPTQNAPAAPTSEMKAAGLTGSPGGIPTPQQNPGGSAGSTIGKIMTWFAIGISAMIVFSFLALISAWSTVTLGAIPMAALVIALGVGLVVLAVRGRRQLSIWMLATALVIAVPMAFIAIADIRIEGGYGNFVETPAVADEIPVDGYTMAAGATTIDLRKFDFRAGDPVDLKVNSGIGATRIIIPDDVCVTGTVSGKAGLADIRGNESSGFKFDRRFTAGTSGEIPGLQLDGEFQLGYFEIIDETDWNGGASVAGRNDYDDWERGRTEDSENNAAARQRATDACIMPATQIERKPGKSEAPTGPLTEKAGTS